jgi:prophage regulatory protein
MTERILRRPEVELRTGLGRSAIYLAISEGKFPRPIKLGERAVGWPESIINKWIETKIKKSSLGGQNAK